MRNIIILIVLIILIICIVIFLANFKSSFSCQTNNSNRKNPISQQTTKHAPSKNDNYVASDITHNTRENDNSDIKRNGKYVINRKSERIASEGMLIESMQPYPRVLELFEEINEKTSKYVRVYGIKNNDELEWELYFITSNIHPLMDIYRTIFKDDYDLHALQHIKENNLFIISIDISRETAKARITPKLNLYYKIENKPYTCFKEISFLHDGSHHYRGITAEAFLYETHKHNIGSIATSLEIHSGDIMNILRIIESLGFEFKRMSITDKGEDFGLYFRDLKYSDLYNVVKKLNFDSSILEIVGNEDNVRSVFEIGMYFHKNEFSGKPYRSGIYGNF